MATSPPKNRRRRPAEVRSLLLESAAREFAAHGYAAATKKDIAQRADIALSVLDRHFESKAELFAESVLVPFAEFLEQLSSDWLRQRDEPLPDEPLMHFFISDMFESLSTHKDAVQGLTVARDELDADIVRRLRAALDDLFGQLRLIAELESERRGWFSAERLELTLRIFMGMVLGMTSYDWILLPDDPPDPELLVDEMSKLATWGLARRPPT